MFKIVALMFVAAVALNVFAPAAHALCFWQ